MKPRKRFYRVLPIEPRRRSMRGFAGRVGESDSGIGGPQNRNGFYKIFAFEFSKPAHEYALNVSQLAAM